MYFIFYFIKVDVGIVNDTQSYILNRKSAYSSVNSISFSCHRLALHTYVQGMVKKKCPPYLVEKCNACKLYKKTLHTLIHAHTSNIERI